MLARCRFVWTMAQAVSEGAGLVVEMSDGLAHSFGYVFMGGTFDRLHSGHELLLRAAARVTRDQLTIGVTDNSMLTRKAYADIIQPYEVRELAVREFVRTVNPALDCNIVKLVEPFGPSVSAEHMHAMVASAEPAVLGNIARIRETRRARGLSDDFVLVLVPMVSASGDTVAAEADKVSSSELRRRAFEAAAKAESAGQA